MAAAVLESLAVHHAGHSAGMRYIPLTAPLPAPSTLGHWPASLMPEFKGLSITSRPPITSSALRWSSGKVSRKGTVTCKAQNTTVDVPDLTKASWKSLVMESDKPVLVEFWAPWCGPCRMILPMIAKLSKTYEDKIRCFKLNTDEIPDIAIEYGIRSIPTIIIFKRGEKKDTIIGAVPESTLATCIEKYA